MTHAESANSDALETAPARGSEGPAHSEEIVGHRRERGRRIRLSIFSSLLVKPLAVITPIITVPLFVQYLGPERYGLYESVTALAIWLGLTNAGLTLGLMNKLTECHVANDRELARKYVSSLSLALLVIVILVGGLWTLAAPLVNWQIFFPSDDPVARAETPWAVLAAGWCTLLALILTIPTSIYTAYQETYRANLWDGIARIATLIACVVVVYTHWGLVGVVLAATLTTVVARLPNAYLLFFREKPWLRPDRRYFDWALLVGTMKHGLGLFIVSSSAMALFNGDKLIISALLGPEVVAGYAIVGRVFLLTFGLYVVVVSTLWPAYGEAVRRGDLHWVRQSLARSLAFGFAAILGCGVVMWFFGDPLLRIWTRTDQVTASRPLIAAMTCMFLLWTWMSGLSILLNASGVIRAQAKVIAAHAVLHLVVAFLVARPFGVIGIAWSVSVTGLFTSAWGYPLIVRKYIWRRGSTEPPVAPLVPAAE